jgi:glycosyltransferase involved in cell wall biosynthesis
MQTLHISHSLNKGGAAIATKRIIKGLNKTKKHDINVELISVEKTLDKDGSLSCFAKKFYLIIRILEGILRRLFSTATPIFHSFGFLPSPLVRHINKKQQDLIHLHWIGYNTLSIEDLSRLKAKKIIWTLHDCWPLEGSAHVPNMVGWYHKNPIREWIAQKISKFVRWRKLRQYRALSDRLIFTAPSNWMADYARSKLPDDIPVVKINHPVDTSIFFPIEQKKARKQLDLPLDKKIICFGADAGDKNSIKGGDMFPAIFDHLKTLTDSGQSPPLILTFGGKRNNKKPEKDDKYSNFDVIRMGRIDDMDRLRAIYNASNVFLCPSYVDAVPQTVMESLACGTPAIVFDTCGAAEFITEPYHGAVIESYDTHRFAESVYEQLYNANDADNQSIASAVTDCTPENIGDQYVRVYQQALEPTD